MKRLRIWLVETIDARILGIYRIFFGLFMAYTMIRYYRIGLIENMFVLPKINFKYDGFYWLEPLPPVWMNVLLASLFFSAVLIVFGLFFKWACRYFAMGYLYLFLLDKGIYNNHIYLFILIAFLLSFTQADRVFSLRKGRAKDDKIPRWQIFILQVQVMIVYFYGGIAKLTHDWILKAEPVRTLAAGLDKDSVFSLMFNHEPGIFFLNYGGLLLDLGAPLLLWHKPFRKWSVWIFIGFNLTNSRLFQDIGIFPFVMLANLILFYEMHEIPGIRNLVMSGKKNKSRKTLGASLHTCPVSSFTKIVLMVYFAFQFLFPFRGHFLPNPLDWTTIGNKFSWRMKVDTRIPESLNFFIHSPDFNTPAPVEINTFINDMQMLNLSMDPRSVRDFAVFLKKEAMFYGTREPAIKAEIMVKYNGRSAAYFVDPEVDLAKVEYHPLKKLDWVFPVPR